MARAITFGLDSQLKTPFWSAAKTGTSEDMRDNWCVGYSTRYTIAVWVGNFEGDSMRAVSGVSGAAPIWHELMLALQGAQGGSAPQPPATVEARQLRFSQQVEAGRREWFLRGAEAGAATVVAVPESARPSIQSPANGSGIRESHCGFAVDRFSAMNRRVAHAGFAHEICRGPAK